jgi:hypothetical protein
MTTRSMRMAQHPLNSPGPQRIRRTAHWRLVNIGAAQPDPFAGRTGQSIHSRGTRYLNAVQAWSPNEVVQYSGGVPLTRRIISTVNPDGLE